VGLKGKVLRQVAEGDRLKVWRTHEGAIAADKGWSLSLAVWQGSWTSSQQRSSYHAHDKI